VSPTQCRFLCEACQANDWNPGVYHRELSSPVSCGRVRLWPSAWSRVLATPCQHLVPVGCRSARTSESMDGEHVRVCTRRTSIGDKV
jgi:hypothetical protein